MKKLSDKGFKKLVQKNIDKVDFVKTILYDDSAISGFIVKFSDEFLMIEETYDFSLSGTSIIADEVLISKPIVILPGFSDGTDRNAEKEPDHTCSADGGNRKIAEVRGKSRDAGGMERGFFPAIRRLYYSLFQKRNRLCSEMWADA